MQLVSIWAAVGVWKRECGVTRESFGEPWARSTVIKLPEPFGVRERGGETQGGLEDCR